LLEEVNLFESEKEDLNFVGGINFSVDQKKWLRIKFVELWFKF